MGGLDTDSATRTLQHTSVIHVVPYVHPFTKVYKRLDEFNWDPIAIDEEVRRILGHENECFKIQSQRARRERNYTKYLLLSYRTLDSRHIT